MKLPTLLLFVFLAGTIIASSTPLQHKVTGTVTDANTGEPLPGVNVLIEGTLTGVSTDLNGNYSIPKPADGAIIAFSFIGYTAEKITYEGQTVLDIKLPQEVKELDQVVVIGYGTIKKSDLTGSVASVSLKDFEKSSPQNIQQALQGRVAGLMITSNTGAPGSQAMILIRGVGTVNNNSPIYVIDGMIIDPTVYGNINIINPLDIESIEVLKDASAQAIYGSRGANGVFLIETHKGKEGLPKVTFNSTVGFENMTRVPEVLNRDEFRDYIQTCYTNGYLRTHQVADPTVPLETLMNEYPTVRNMITEYDFGAKTDWTREVLRKNVLNQNFNLSLSGGSKYSHYSASAAYLNNSGLIRNYDHKRYSFRLNTDYKVGKYITIGENLGITNIRRSGGDYAVNFQNATYADPLAPVLKPEGSVDVTDPYYEYKKYEASLIVAKFGNPVLDVELVNNKYSVLTLVGNMFAEAMILKNLKFRTSWGFNIFNSDQSGFSPVYYLSPSFQNAISTITTSNYRTDSWIWENTLTYSKTTKNHSITALFGYTSEYTKLTNQTASKQGTPNNEPEMQTFDAATTQPNVSGGYNVLTMISKIGRINYSFRNKYLLTVSIRNDGSSKFGEGHRRGTFPSFSLGWKISNEEFFRNLGTGFINDFKLRAGWGQIGNSSLPVYYAYTSQVASGTIAGIDNRYIFNEQVLTGFFLKTIGTPGISWETTEQTNIGVDISLLKNSLSASADFYIRNIDDMLLQVPVPMYAGYPATAAPYTNAGSVQNKGFELLVDYKGQSGDFSYDIAVNGAMFRNKVTSLGQGNKPIIYSFNRTEVGSSIGRFYGWVTDGIFQTDQEAQSYKGPGGTVLQPEARAGDFRFKNLNNDDAINQEDQTWIGDPWPKLTYGVNMNLRYRDFDLVMLFQGSCGNDIARSGLMRKFDFLGSLNEYTYIYTSAWRGPGTSNSQPLLSSADQNDNYRISDYFVEDGSYLRLKLVQIGYNLPGAICDKVKITEGRVWIGGTNLLTVTKYRGLDPEVGAVGTPTSQAGCDPDTFFPKSSEISLGFSISF